LEKMRVGRDKLVDEDEGIEEEGRVVKARREDETEVHGSYVSSLVCVRNGVSLEPVSVRVE
jgi:hypothetical protein